MSEVAVVGRVETPTTESPVVHPSRWAAGLSFVVVALLAIATLGGLFWDDGVATSSVTTARGESVELYGDGLYRYDSAFKGAGNVGTDVVLLGLMTPLLVATTLAYRRGSLRGSLLHLGALATVLYVYATMAVGTAYNEFFLVYVALFGCSLHALIGAVRSIDLSGVESRLSERGPRKSLAFFLMVSGVFTAVMWVSPILLGLASDVSPELLGSASTLVTEALDLAIIVPATILTGWMLLKGKMALAYLCGFPLLFLLVWLTPTVAAQTISQLSAGMSFTTAEIVGPITGFLVLGVVGATFMARMLRSLRL